MPSFEKMMKPVQAYPADIQEFLRETGYLPTNIDDLVKSQKCPEIVIPVKTGGVVQTSRSEEQPNSLSLVKHPESLRTARWTDRNHFWIFPSVCVW